MNQKNAISFFRRGAVVNGWNASTDRVSLFNLVKLIGINQTID